MRASELLDRHPDLLPVFLEWLGGARQASPVHGGVAPVGLPPLRVVPGDRYESFSVVGRGGQGIVYRATDIDLQRDVAFKALRTVAADLPNGAVPGTPWDLPAPTGPGDSDLALTRERFLQEALITGGLSHPGIAPLYEIGQTPLGVPYYTMRFIKGETTLRTRMADLAVAGVEARLALLEPYLKVCDTIEYAHSRGVVHRDLKPENVAIGRYGEVVVLDWGLAAMLPEIAASRSHWHQAVEKLKRGRENVESGVLGTPGYMAPETFSGANETPGTSGDVYALGTILYEILTGRHPHSYRSLAEYVERVTREDPAPARSVDPAVPEELSSLSTRALARHPERRPSSIGDLTAEIRAWQSRTAMDREVGGLLREARTLLDHAEGMSGEDLLREVDRAAAPLHQVLRLRPGEGTAQQEMRRASALRERAQAEHRAAVELAARRSSAESRRRAVRRIAFSASLLVVAATVVAALYASDRRRDAERNAARAASAEEQARTRLGQTLAHLSVAYGQEGRRAAARLASATALETRPTPDTWRALASAARFALPTFRAVSLNVHVLSLAFDPARGLLYAGCEDGDVRVWDLGSGAEQREFHAHDDPVTALALSRDGRHLYTGGAGLIRKWDAVDEKVLDTLVGMRGAVRRILVTDGEEVLIAIDGGPTGGRGPDGEGSEEAGEAPTTSTVQVWDLKERDKPWHIEGVEGFSPGAVCLDPRAGSLLVGAEGTVIEWSLSARRPIRAFHVAVGRVSDLWVTADGSLLFVATEGAGDERFPVEIRDRKTFEVRSRVGQKVLGGFDRLAFDARDRVLYASRTRGGWIDAWSLRADEPEEQPGRRGRSPVLVLPSVARVVARHDEDSLCVYSARGSQRVLAQLPVGHAHAIRKAAGSPDGRRLITWDHSGVLRTWECEPWQCTARTSGLGAVQALAVAPLGTDRAAVAQASRVTWIDTTVGTPGPSLTLPDVVSALAFSRDGTHLYATTYSGSIFILSPGSSTRRALAELPDTALTALSVSARPSGQPGDRLLAATWKAAGAQPASADVIGWDVPGDDDAPASRRIQIHTPHASPITQLSCSASGALVATGSPDGRVELWSGEDGSARPTPVDVRGALDAIAISRDGDSLCVASHRPDARPRAHEGPARSDQALIRVWTLRRPEVVQGRRGPVPPPAPVPLATPMSAGSPLVAPPEAGRLTAVLEAQTHQILALVPAAGDARMFSIGSTDRGEILEWELRATPPPLRGLSPEVPAVLALALAPGGRTVYAGLGDSEVPGTGGARGIAAYDTAPEGSIALLDDGADEPGCNRIDGRALALSPRGERLFSGVWRAEPGGNSPCSAPPEEASEGGASTKDGRIDWVPPEQVGAEVRSPEAEPQLVAAYRLVKVLTLPTGDEPLRYPRPTPSYLHVDRPYEAVLDLTASTDGRRVYAAGRSGTVYEYDVEKLSLLRRFRGGDAPASAIAIAPDAALPELRRLYVGDRDGLVRVWDLRGDGRLEFTFRAHDTGIGALLVSCDGRCLYSAAGTRGIADERSQMLMRPDTTVRRWDAAAHQLIGTFSGHEDSITCLAIQGGTLYSGSLDGTVRVWDIAKEELEAVLDTGGASVRSLAIAPGGARLFCGTEEQGLLEFDLRYFLEPPAVRVRSIEGSTGLRMDRELLGVRRVLRDNLSVAPAQPSAHPEEGR